MGMEDGCCIGAGAGIRIAAVGSSTGGSRWLEGGSSNWAAVPSCPTPAVGTTTAAATWVAAAVVVVGVAVRRWQRGRRGARRMQGPRGQGRHSRGACTPATTQRLAHILINTSMTGDYYFI